MIIDFDKIPETAVANFKGGDLEANMRVCDDGAQKIMKIRLRPGASIGEHTHTDNCEIVLGLSGSATAVTDGVEETILPGIAHYCPKGHKHTIRNTGDTDFIFFAIVG